MRFTLITFVALFAFAKIVAVSASFEALSAGVEGSLYTTTGEETSIHFLVRRQESAISGGVSKSKTHDDTGLCTEWVSELDSHDTLWFRLQCE